MSKLFDRFFQVADPHGSWFRIQIRLRVKSWIQIRIKLETLGDHNRAADVHNGGLEAQNGALDGLQTSGRRFPSLPFVEEQDPDPH
jgi:hypothetical protein